MTDHSSLVPSFRDFSFYMKGHSTLHSSGDSSSEGEAELRLPNILEVERILRESAAGRLGKAVDTEGWPWLERMEFLEGAIPGIKVHSIGGYVPFEADGIWGPYEWYYRERGGGATLSLAPIGTFPAAADGLYRASQSVDEFAGSTGWVSRFLGLWEQLSVAKFLYKFSARDISVEKDENSGLFSLGNSEELKSQYGWGHSPEEAWLETQAFIQYFEEKLGWSQEFQREWRERMEISRVPLNADERVFPAEAPDFRVNWEALDIPEDYEHFIAG